MRQEASRLEFYAAAAQVIPVLVVAIFLEGRIIVREWSDSRLERFFNRYIAMFVAFVILGGEYAALEVLWTGEVRNLTDTMVYSALAAEAGILVGAAWALSSPSRPSQARPTPTADRTTSPQPRVGIAGLLSALLILLAVRRLPRS